MGEAQEGHLALPAPQGLEADAQLLTAPGPARTLATGARPRQRTATKNGTGTNTRKAQSRILDVGARRRSGHHCRSARRIGRRGAQTARHFTTERLRSPPAFLSAHRPATLQTESSRDLPRAPGLFRKPLHLRPAVGRHLSGDPGPFNWTLLTRRWPSRASLDHVRGSERNGYPSRIFRDSSAG